MSDPDVRRAKKRGLKILVGGPGAWQLRFRTAFVERYGIDCVVEGEAEKVIGKIMHAALNGEELPRLYESSVAEAAAVDEIPDIVGPSVNGLVEIGRGCCRGCRFCSVTLRPLRWYPLQKIMREVGVNLKSGNISRVVPHAEDVMLYGSRNTTPNEEKLLKLHKALLKNCDSIAWSHCTLATVALKPKLFAEISELIRQKQAWWGAEIGIETGSENLAEKMMPAKAHPFKAKEWPEVVRSGMGLMHDNCLVPAGTLIVGAPEETEDDVVKTIELMDDLKHVRSLIVPLFFVPMGKLKNEDWFKDTQITELHKELLIKCLEHDLYWVNDLVKSSFGGSWYGTLLRPFFEVFVLLARYNVKKAGILKKLETTRLKYDSKTEES
jgi:radical SAM superfamily enzyme YgiQ (UPF0313 family)